MKQPIDKVNNLRQSEALKIKTELTMKQTIEVKMKWTTEDQANDWRWSEWLIRNKWLKMKQTIEDEAYDWMASESVCESYDEGWGRWVERAEPKPRQFRHSVKIL